MNYLKIGDRVYCKKDLNYAAHIHFKKGEYYFIKNIDHIGCNEIYNIVGSSLCSSQAVHLTDGKPIANIGPAGTFLHIEGVKEKKVGGNNVGKTWWYKNLVVYL